MASDDIRHGRYWLLAAQLAAIAPQWDHLPLWLMLAVVGACLWRTPRVEISLPPPRGAPACARGSAGRRSRSPRLPPRHTRTIPR